MLDGEIHVKHFVLEEHLGGKEREREENEKKGEFSVPVSASMLYASLCLCNCTMCIMSVIALHRTIYIYI